MVSPVRPPGSHRRQGSAHNDVLSVLALRKILEMRLPWIQVDEDGMTRCRLLARLLGVREAEGFGIGVSLWRWALEMAKDGDFSGDISEADPSLVAAAVGWPIDQNQKLIADLQRVGLISTNPGLRVRGLDRYRRAWEKNNRKPSKSMNYGDEVPVSGASSAGNRAEPARQTETETETETKKKQKTASEKTPAPPLTLVESCPPKPKKPKPEKPTDPRHAPLVKVLCEVFSEVRGSEYPFGPRDAAAVRDLLAAEGPDVIAPAWARALRHGGFPAVSTLPELHRNLAHFVGAGPPVGSKAQFDPNQGIIRDRNVYPSNVNVSVEEQPAPNREDPFPWSRQ